MGENETQMIVWKLVRETTDRRYLSVTENKIQTTSLDGRALSEVSQKRNGRKEKEEKQRWGGRGRVEEAINKGKARRP